MSIEDEGLEARLREKALSAGATYFGVADLVPARDFVTAQGGDFLAEYPVGISVGFALADGIVDQLHHHLNGHVARTYQHHIYAFVAAQLDGVAGDLAFQIEQAGHRAIPVPQSGPYNEARFRGLISHKLAAHLAGLGWIGKNSLLITKAHGPRVRWVTVLTDAPLAGTGGTLADGDKCKSCTVCVDLCPAQAFADIPFNPDEPVEVRFNAKDCHRYRVEREKVHGVRTCGICVYVCPHGWSMKRKKDSQRTTPALLHRQLDAVVKANVAPV